MRKYIQFAGQAVHIMIIRKSIKPASLIQPPISPGIPELAPYGMGDLEVIVRVMPGVKPFPQFVIRDGVKGLRINPRL